MHADPSVWFSLMDFALLFWSFGFSVLPWKSRFINFSEEVLSCGLVLLWNARSWWKQYNEL